MTELRDAAPASIGRGRRGPGDRGRVGVVGGVAGEVGPGDEAGVDEELAGEEEGVAHRAGRAPGGESEWVAEAVREKLAACAELEALEGRAARGRLESYARVLAKVPAAAPVPGDER